MTTDDQLSLTPKQQRRLHILTRLLAGHCSASEAAQLLGLSVRQLWRLKAAYQRDGLGGLVHGNRGRPKPWRIDDDLKDRIRSLVAEHYADCNDSHLVEILVREHEIPLSRPSLSRILRTHGHPSPQHRRAPRHRRRRDRYSQIGMLLQVDGSPHHWLGPDQPRSTLIAAIDDATSAVVAAVFRAQEDAHGYFLVLQQILAAHGLPMALYHDRHGIFRREPGARWTLDEELAGRQEPTQFGRALEELGIGSIAALSPQAKGRIERLWGTLQGRLVPELRLAGARTLEQAQAFLPTYLERHNARFAVAANEPLSSYRPVPPGLDLERVLSFRYARVVANDNTVRFAGHVLQLPPGPGRRSYARAHVWVHELLDGSLGVFYEDRWLLRTDPPPSPPVLRARHGPQIHPREPGPPPKTPPDPPPAPKPRWRPGPNHPWRRS